LDCCVFFLPSFRAVSLILFESRCRFPGSFAFPLFLLALFGDALLKVGVTGHGVLDARVHLGEELLDFVFVGALASPLNDADKVASAW
jgi:hypothetical protein